MATVPHGLGHSITFICVDDALQKHRAIPELVLQPGREGARRTAIEATDVVFLYQSRAHTAREMGPAPHKLRAASARAREAGARDGRR